MKTVIRICIVVTVIWGSTSTTRATIRNVPSAYPTIQAAIDTSINGDEIVVADGIYTGVGNCNLNFYGKAVTLRGENGPEVCIIDCEGNGRGISFVSGEGPSTVLEGMTIRNARTIGGYPVSYGAGIKCVDSSPTITDCILGNNNTDHSGGGIGIIGGSPTISKCVFTENSAIDGSGIVIHKYDSATVPQVDITECVFTNNCSISNNGDGGGIFVGESEVLITNCIFEGNSARCGGAIYHQLGTLTIINCLITNNSASLCGGGLGFGWGSQKTVCNCTISNNSVDDSYPGQTRGGGGVWTNSETILTNCILWSNSAGLGPQLQIWQVLGTPPGSLTINYSDVEGGQSSVHVASGCTLNWGSDNIDADPTFEGADDLRLSVGSPCIDTGDNDEVMVATDLGGNPRILNGIVDMGAYESEVFVLPSPADQIEYILEFVDKSIEAGTLVGQGSGASAKNRLKALINMLKETQSLILNELFEEAFEQLDAAFELTDGLTPPPDFVTGDAAAELAILILCLMGSL